MFIKINLETTEPHSRKFSINSNALADAIKGCYLGLGTPYQPIAVDNFVDLDGNQLPIIPSNAKITITLHPKNNNSRQYKLYDPKLVCCKIKNVDRAFNDRDLIDKDYWNQIFNCDHEHIFCAPEGTLYISPDIKNACHISTRKKFPNTMVAYSILFSLIIEHLDGYKRRYYFILDPLVDVRSNPPK